MELIASNLTELNKGISQLGSRVEQAVDSAIHGLRNHDIMFCEMVISRDVEIDRAEIELEEHCLALLCENRLPPSEIRNVVAILKINNDLERIGDLAVNIAETTQRLINIERFRFVGSCDKIARTAQAMLEESLKAFVQRDVYLARTIISADDEVDRLQASMQRRLQQEIDRVPENVGPLMQLDFITRQLERIGDMATNIAENVIYMVEGKIVRHSPIHHFH